MPFATANLVSPTVAAVVGSPLPPPAHEPAASPATPRATVAETAAPLIANRPLATYLPPSAAILAEPPRRRSGRRQPSIDPNPRPCSTWRSVARSSSSGHGVEPLGKRPATLDEDACEVELGIDDGVDGCDERRQRLEHAALLRRQPVVQPLHPAATLHSALGEEQGSPSAVARHASAAAAIRTASA